MAMKCKICNGSSEPLFEKKVMNKYAVSYYRCTNCFFIQTEEPYWLEESYSSAITDLDLGLVQRNIEFTNIVSCVINSYFNKRAQFLDFAGGYGLLVRMMRDEGFNYYRQDKYCANLFTNHFDVTDLPEGTPFEIASAFEVFEHLPDPMQTIDEMLSYADNVLFSTRLQPGDENELTNWWYIAPEIGQHVAIYHKRTLEEIAKQKQLFLYTNNKNFHLLTRKKINAPLFRFVTDPRIAKWRHFLAGQGKSLLQADYDYVKQKVYGNNNNSAS